MEIYIARQLADLGSAMLLGIVCGTVYDLLRPIRLQRRCDRVLTHVVDALYILIMLLGVFLFVLRIGKGEFRLFMLFGFIGGIAVYYLLLSELLRPLWDFWMEAMTGFLALLWKPFIMTDKILKKVGQFVKKYFHFLRKYATIKRYKWEFGHLHNSMTGRGGPERHEKKRKNEKET